MNSTERVIRSIKHQEVDRCPTYFQGHGNTNARLAEKLGIPSTKLGYMEEGHGHLLDRLGCDMQLVWPLRQPTPGRSFFSCGSVHAAIHGGTMVYQKMPLEDAENVDDILNYGMWPSPDWFDYKIPSWMLPSLKERAVCAYDMYILFLYAMGIRGMENFMMDMAAEPDMAHAVMKKISDYHLERLRRFLTVNEGVIDMVGIGDDVAGQNGMFFSMEMWKEYLKPYLLKAVDLCHEFKVIPYFHGCGGFSVLYKDFIEMGITCTGRLQTEAKGNNFSRIKKEYGKDLCLVGAVDCQHIAIEKSPEEVREHVRELLRNNFDGTGYIAGPTHSFTEDVPVENILAIYETLKS